MANDIALQVQPIRLDNPVQQYANVLALQNQQRQGQTADLQYKNLLRAQDEETATREAIAGAGGDYSKAANALLSRGLYKPANAMLASQAEADKGKIDMDKARAEALKANLEVYANSLGGLAANPTPEALTAFQTAMSQQKIPLHAPMPSVMDGKALEQWIRSGAAMSKQGLDALKAFAPNVNMTDLGGTVQPTNTNPLAGAVGALPGAAPLEKTAVIPPGMTKGADGKLRIDPGYLDARKAIAAAGRPSTTINMPQEKAFETELGKEQAKELIIGRKGAEDAAEIIRTVGVGKDLLKSGIISGFGAEYITNFGKALNQAGIALGEDAISNTEAFTANMAQNVGKVIKQFGAGTGLSNADREYAEKMAGGKITLNEASIKKILDINDRAARNIIRGHNKKAANVKSNIPMTVDEPSGEPEKKGPKAGAVQDGYRFKGGNPADPKSWEKI